jgi:hypothetical protein
MPAGREAVAHAQREKKKKKARWSYLDMSSVMMVRLPGVVHAPMNSTTFGCRKLLKARRERWKEYLNVILEIDK